MQHNAADELHVVVGHVPLHFVATGLPVVAPYSLVAFDAYEVSALSGKLAVEVGGSDLDSLRGGKARRCFSNCGEYYGEMLVELVFYNVENFLLVFVDFIPKRLALFEGKSVDLGTELCYGLGGGSGGGFDILAHEVYLPAQAVVVELLYFGYFLLDFLENWGDCFEVACRLVAENLLKE